MQTLAFTDPKADSRRSFENHSTGRRPRMPYHLFVTEISSDRPERRRVRHPFDREEINPQRRVEFSDHLIDIILTGCLPILSNTHPEGPLYCIDKVQFALSTGFLSPFSIAPVGDSHELSWGRVPWNEETFTNKSATAPFSFRVTSFSKMS